MEAWISGTPAISERIGLTERRRTIRRIAQGQPHGLSPQFVLLHTFAHVVINQLAFECGYGSASLRERLYCDDDSERSHVRSSHLYGLRRFRRLHGRACPPRRSGTFRKHRLVRYRRPAWCSPIPSALRANGQGAENCNLAACHSCCLLPETPAKRATVCWTGHCLSENRGAKYWLLFDDTLALIDLLKTSQKEVSIPRNRVHHRGLRRRLQRACALRRNSTTPLEGAPLQRPPHGEIRRDTGCPRALPALVSVTTKKE